MRASAVTDLLRRSEFHDGLLVGIAAAAVTRVFRRWARLGFGVAWAAAGFLGVAAVSPVNWRLGIGLLLVFAAGLVPVRLRYVVLALGAAATADATGARHPGWVSWVTFAACMVGGPLVASFDKRWRSLAPVLLGITVAGAYACVPDTDNVSAVLGVAVVMAVTGWLLDASLGRGGAYASVALVNWIVTVGGAGRHASIVGGLGCFVILVAEPIAFAWRPGRTSPPVVVATHLLGVALMSRVVGLRHDTRDALVLAAAVLLCCVAVSSVRARATPRT